MRRWLSFIIAGVLLAGMAVAIGCGGDDKLGPGSSTSSTTTTSTSATPTVTSTGTGDAQQVFDASQSASQSIQSMTFGLDVSATLRGDAAQVTDSTLAGLLNSPINLNVAGKLSNDPQKLDMTLTAGAAGQSYDIGFRMDGDQMWVSFQGSWYLVDKAMISSLTSSALPSTTTSSSGLTQQLQEMITSLGINPNNWSAGFTMVGTESLDGVEVDHISQNIDVTKVVDDLMTVVNSMSGLTGSSTSMPTTEELTEIATTLKTAIKNLTVDWWIEKGNSFLHKMQVVVSVDLSSLPTSETDGLTGIDATVTVTSKDFNQPVTVEAPANPKPFNDLLTAIMSMAQ